MHGNSFFLVLPYILITRPSFTQQLSHPLFRVADVLVKEGFAFLFTYLVLIRPSFLPSSVLPR